MADALAMDHDASLGRAYAITVKGAILATFLGASSAPTPLYHLYQESWNIRPFTVTIIFGAYALGLLAAFLTVGSLSDHIGRRPLILASLALNGVAMIVFATADSAHGLMAARALQGVATGAATSTLGAAILDSDRRHGPLINAVTPFVGMTVGALGSSALVAFGPAPAQTVYLVLLVAMAVQALLIARLPETAETIPGAWASLRPRVHVPPQVRAALLLITPVNTAVWALGGFYLSLMPSVLRAATGYTSPFVGGIVVATLTLSGGAAVLAMRARPAIVILTTSAVTVTFGVGITLAGVDTGAIALLLLGTVVSGLGFGLGFFGALRTILPLAAPDERAGLLSAFYVQSYLAFSLPAILIGFLVPTLGLVRATYFYGAIVMLLATASLAITLVQVRLRARRIAPV